MRFCDNGLLNLFLFDDETSLLENLVAVELCRRYGKDNVSYYKDGNEIDFVVAEERMAIQVSYDIADKATCDREVTPLLQFANKHPDWTFQIITYDSQDSITASNITINVLPAWLWMATPNISQESRV